MKFEFKLCIAMWFVLLIVSFLFLFSATSEPWLLGFSLFFSWLFTIIFFFIIAFRIAMPRDEEGS